MGYGVVDAKRPEPDALLVEIADYVTGPFEPSAEAIATAGHCLIDSLGCALLALRYPECCKLLGPIVPGGGMTGGARVPGTSFELDPVEAAFNIGCLIRWLDFNDTWLAAEWGHPSDNLGGILAVADYLSRQRVASGKTPLTVLDVLVAAIKAHEIQGVLALENSFNRVGLDHVLLVRVATTAVVTGMLGGNKQDVINAVSHAWLDGGALRTYRHAPNTGSRKSWAAGDATRRGVWLAFMTMRGEMGYPAPLSAKTWGFQDVLFKGNSIRLARPLAGYVMENVLFKISFPAEFHAQTAVEAAVQLHPQIAGKLDAIDRIEIATHESAMRIINKTGPLANPADRDHCLQYMTAIGLLFGTLEADHYENATANDPRIDRLRSQMQLREEPRYTRDYLDPAKRSIANAIQVFFKDGTNTPVVEVEYPVGHRRRRTEGIPLLKAKFATNLATRFPASRCRQIVEQSSEQTRFEKTQIHEFMAEFVI